MKTTFVVGFLSVATALAAAGASLPHYINTRPVGLGDETPQIDAVSFENRSSFSISTTRPFETFNTLNFTNTGAGVMENSGSGFWFDHSFLGGRSPMANWINRGLISAPTYMWVEATNILNAGRGVGAGSRGAIHLEGKTVNLSRSTVFTGDLYGSGQGGVGFFGSGYPPRSTNYFDSGIADVYWAISSNTVRTTTFDAFAPGNIFTPFHVVTTSPRGGGRVTSLPNLSTNAADWVIHVYTNRVGGLEAGSPAGTNIIQIVAVPSYGTNFGMTVDVRFTPHLDSGNQPVGWLYGNVAMVRFGLAETNASAGTVNTNYLYLEDYLPFLNTNRFLAGNSATALGLQARTRRPSTFYFSRTPSGSVSFDDGETNNTAYNSSLWNNGNYLSNNVTADFAAYSARILMGTNTIPSSSGFSSLFSSSFGAFGSLFSRIFRDNSLIEWAGLPKNDITNFAGRVELIGDTLDLRQARVRAESGIVVKTPNLVAGSLPLMEAPLLSLDLGSRSGSLMVSNVAPAEVNRLLGQVSAYSSIWQNASTNGNVTNYWLHHLLVVDHSLGLTQAVVLQDLKLRSTNVTIADTIRVTRDFLIEATNLTITATGDVLNGSGADIGSSNLLSIVNFTNRGVFAASGELRLGSDLTTPWSNIVNHGIIAGAGVATGSRLLINSNQIYSLDGAVTLDADDMRFHGTNTVQSVGGITLQGGSLFATNSSIIAGSLLQGGSLILDFTDSIQDGGINSSNIWQVTDGFVVARAPATGDLLGTTIISIAPTNFEAFHSIGAVDHGVDPQGYVNNIAIGKLVLDGRSNSVFRFTPPPGVSNAALYVDYLELRNYATNWTDSIIVDEGCTLYFADSNVSPYRDLNHSSGDRLRWVSTYAGPRSTTNFSYTIPSVGTFSYDLNKALVLLADIDSDNDGVANVNDTTPVWVPEQALLSCTLTNFGVIQNVPALSGRALVTYNDGVTINYATNTIEYTLDLINGPWLVLTNIVTPTVSSVPPQYQDFLHLDLAATNKVRHYRMSVRVTDP